MVSPLRLIACVSMLWSTAACTPGGTFVVSHHRSNGCDDTAPENSMQALRCVIEKCAEGTAPCALEGDARILRLEGGSLGDDLEIVWMHDGTTARTAACPSGSLDVPGNGPTAPSRFSECRLTRLDGSLTEETIPTLAQVLDELMGSGVTLFLELKTAGASEIDERLAVGAVEALNARGMGPQTIVTSFDPAAIAPAMAADIRTACFAPTGSIAGQLFSVFRGSVGADADRCANDGHDFVFVAADQLNGNIVSHVRQAGAGLGVFGANNAAGRDAVIRWAHAVDVVHADDPLIYFTPP